MSNQNQAGVAVISAGQALIPTATALTRLHFYDGKFLRGPDLTLEQEYLLAQVRLSNQSGGSGIVHGLTCALRNGRLVIGAGLAMDPRGRALLLPEDAELPLAPLIEAASGTGASTGTGQDGFGDCASETIDDPGPTSAADGLYLLVALHTEAFCGSEEVYGRLCETACVSDSERPYIREGIVVQALPLSLALPVFGIALGTRHERSRVASAYFRRGDGIWASLIGGGRCSMALERARDCVGDLLSDLWCQGALLAGGEALPLAVLSYRGGTVRFLDNWIARRERMTAPARGYWAGRMGMRPWPVFLAEVLQFQCQLPGALSAGGGDDTGEDPCAPDRAVVQNAAELIDSLQQLGAGQPDGLPEALARLTIDAGVLLPSLRALAITPASDQVLIDGGIIELPSAGWLPVDPASTETVNDQVRRLLGAGVDLRFCIVRPDYVQHALEEAQHMARISLLQGIDDPSARPEVDILVPNGQIQEQVQQAPGSGYALTMDIIEPGREDPGTVVGNADDFSATPPSGGGAGSGRLGPRILAAERIGRVRNAFIAVEAAAPRTGPMAIDPVLVANPGADDEEIDLSGAARDGLAADGSYGLSLAGRTPSALGGFSPGVLTTRFAATGRAALAAAAAGDATEDRSIWLDFHIERDPFTIADGARLRVDLRLVWLQVTNRPVNDPVTLSDVRLFGYLTRQRRLQAGGRDSLIGRLEVDGSIGEPDEGQPPEAVQFAGRLRIDRDNAPSRLTLSFAIAQALPDDLVGTTLVLSRTWSATERSRYLLRMIRVRNNEQETRDLVSGGLLLEPGIAAPTHPLHARAVAALTRIGNGLDSATFADAAAAVLFPPPLIQTGDLLVRACEDWVLFHRRRSRTCAADEPAAEPLPERVYRVYRIPAPSADDVARIIEALRLDLASELDAYDPAAVTLAAFAPGVQTLRTDRDAIRAQWQIGLRPETELSFAAIASLGAAYDEGPELALARLANLLGVLAPVTPTEGARLEHLDGFPSALGGGAIDGVVALVTLVPAVETICHDLFVIVADDWDSILDDFDGAPVDTVLNRHQASLLFSGARFEPDGTALTTPADADAIAQAWQAAGLAGEPIEATVVAVPEVPDDATPEATLLRQQGSVLRAATGEQGTDLVFLRPSNNPDRTPCPRVTILFIRPPVQVPIEVHPVLVNDVVIAADLQALSSQLTETLAAGTWVDLWDPDPATRTEVELGRPGFQGTVPVSGALEPLVTQAQALSLIGPNAPADQQLLVFTTVAQGRVGADPTAPGRAVQQAEMILSRLGLGVQAAQVVVQRPDLPEGSAAITLIIRARQRTGGFVPGGLAAFRTAELNTPSDGAVVTGADPLTFDLGGAVVRDAAFDETVRGLDAGGTPIRTIEVVREDAPTRPGATDPSAESLLAALRDAGVATADARVVVRQPTSAERVAIGANPDLAGGALVFRR